MQCRPHCSIRYSGPSYPASVLCWCPCQRSAGSLRSEHRRAPVPPSCVYITLRFYLIIRVVPHPCRIRGVSTAPNIPSVLSCHILSPLADAPAGLCAEEMTAILSNCACCSPVRPRDPDIVYDRVHHHASSGNSVPEAFPSGPCATGVWAARTQTVDGILSPNGR